MALINTINFLPEVFRSSTNQRFLGATLDQLTTDAYNIPVNGYIGRKFAPTFKSGDNYVPELSVERTNYQLEPSAVIKNNNNEIVFNANYIDLLQSVKNYNGFADNHKRLFKSDSYNFDPKIDFDKFVNYGNYYWLPDGPDSVSVTSSATPYQANYTVTRDTNVGGYTFSGLGGHPNTQITLARGGTYTFVIDQPGFKFWIQSEPGVSGLDDTIPTLSTRDVFGVNNNGIDRGVIRFNVPAATAQDFYSAMPITSTVNAAVNFEYTSIQNRMLSNFMAEFPNGLDGINNLLQHKTFIFVNNTIDDEFWTTPNIPAEFTGTSTTPVVPGSVIPRNQRVSVWQINLIASGNDYLIQLQPTVAVGAQEKVFVGSGQTYASTQFWLNNNLRYQVVPAITAAANYLYYQDSSNPNFVGQIKLVDNETAPINVTGDIIGKANYTSPNGVVFTNGLKVRFDSLVVPSTYANGEYYVEGVGVAISLVPVTQLVAPESFYTSAEPEPDYITINRASQDLNPWTRSNHWFHKEVLQATADYNQTTINYGPNISARRAIVEFEPNLQLFCFGKQAKNNVDLITFTETDAFADIEGQPTYTLDGTLITQGMRIIFANDIDMSVRDEVWEVDFELVGLQNFLRLLPAVDNIVEPKQNVLVLNGVNKGNTYWFDGTNWNTSQVKESINQAPLFDLVDANGYSFADATVYPGSNFAGTKIFGYHDSATGVNDPVLGFPLKYQNFNNIGDIVFVNYYDVGTSSTPASFEYNDGTVNFNTGYIVKNTLEGEPKKLTNWIESTEPTEQYQVITKFHDGYVLDISTETTAILPLHATALAGSYPFVQIDALPIESATVPHLKVFLNNQLLTLGTDYQLVPFGVYYTVILLTTVEVGDKIDVKILSNKVSQFGYYEVPENLDFNPLNEQFGTITLGQIRTHYNKLIENTSISSVSVRDRYIKASGGTLLQHNSPVIYALTFLNSSDANFVDGITLARKEYTRFKNRFLSLCSSLKGLDYNDPMSGVDAILQSINSVKNSSFPWYYSDMVPYGGNYKTIAYTVLNARQTNYELSTIFDNTSLSNKAVLIYHNGQQLTEGSDYQFSKSSPTVIINVALAVNDSIVIREYSNTDANFVPETPTKLGLYPKFPPAIYTDTTYQTPTQVIRGHDGSLTPAFGDFRDQYLLELELRIYNNIKADYSKNEINLYDTIPGKFRTTDYSLSEWNRLITQNFLQWAGSNNIDYTTNSWFNGNNPWTWNYNTFIDSISNEPLQGSWRAIYKYWFDTDTPNLTPWEMLGFGQQPSWWETRYGPAPFTGGNTTLWEDLEAGYIWNNGNPYTDTRFARPGLTNFIPVDSSGNLVDPTRINIIKEYNPRNASSGYQVGEQGPVETAWRRSSDYPYAVQMAIALARPAQYFATQIDTSRFNNNSITNQFSNSANQKISPSLLKVNGDSTTGTTMRTSGYLNWIADSIKNLGIDPVEKLNSYFSGFSVQLSYKVAGFTDQRLITVSAEQTSPGSTNASVIIPDENYSVYLGKPIPVNSITYSAVIVTVADNGYSVAGYDTTNPYFTVIPSIANNDNSEVNVNGVTAKIYRTSSKTATTIPYGTTFATIQQVVDFLISYERYLVSQGFVFERFDTELTSTRDWTLSANEFIFWAQQGWATGTVLVLNPTVNILQVNTQGSIVDEITNLPNGSKILDANFTPIKTNHFSVLRKDSPTKQGNNFVVEVIDSVSTIAFVKLNLIRYENVLVFDNVDDFGDIIYIPSQGTRQYRLKITGAKTGGWDGALSPTGYVYSNPVITAWQAGTDYKQGDIVVYNNSFYTAPTNISAGQNFSLSNWTRISSSDIQTGLLPSFGHNAQVFTQIYDVDKPPQDENYQLFSAGLLGFRERPFLSNLGISIPTQTKFYQGYIKQKGTNSAIEALTKSTFDNVNSTIKTYEEWAFQVGQYGDINSNQYREFILDQSVFLTNPVALTLTANSYSTGNAIVELSLANIYNASNLSSTSTSLFNNRTTAEYSTDLPTPGYVNIDDVDLQVFDITQVEQLSKFGTGTKVWVAKDFAGGWNVYRVNETNVAATKLTYTLDSHAQLTFADPHGLDENEFFLLENFNSYFDGLYQVISVINQFNVIIKVRNPDQLVKMSSQVEAEGVSFKLESLRISGIDQLENIRPVGGWHDGDRVWIDSASESGWGVLSFNRPWLANTASRVTANTVTTNSYFGAASSINSSTGTVLIGAPGSKTVTAYNKVGNAYSASTTITSAHTGFGAAIQTVGDLTVVGAPGSAKVCVYTQSSGAYSLLQTVSAANTSANFGSSIALSSDKHWMFVTEPKQSKVYAYWTSNVSTGANYTLVSTISTTGNVVTTNSNGTILFVGAPNDANTVNGAGNVYIYSRTANSFARSQTISAQHKNVNAAFGTSIAIDGTAGNLFVGVPGSTASGIDNGLVERWIKAGSTYVFDQEISHPDQEFGYFGSYVSVSADSRVLAVGSPSGSAEELTTFDYATTIIDENSTQFVDKVYAAGTVYMFEPIIDRTLTNDTGYYSYTYELSGSINTGDQFGYSIAASSDVVVAGAIGANSNAGYAYIYPNRGSSVAWQWTRNQQAKVDINSINRTFIFDKNDNVIMAAVDFVDPAKGKVLNAVGNDIDYQLTADPAFYNVGTNSVNDFHWGPQQVGKIWWDIDAVRYIDYEQDSLHYRINNWGEMFPGSEILVYEWVESSVPPSQYVATVGDGVPLYEDDSFYCTQGYVSGSGTVSVRYYFWVKGKTSVNTKAGKTNSVYSISAAIENPRAQGISYATVLRNDTIAIYNVTNNLVGTNSILHVDSRNVSSGLIHSEYALVQEGNPVSQIPASITSKLIDSLAGQDAAGNPVPDPALTPAQAYGIKIRPRQSMFVNRNLALNNYFTLVNSYLADYPIVERKLMTILNSGETVPASVTVDRTVANLTERDYINTSTLSVGEMVLVESDSTYNNKWAVYQWSGTAWEIPIRNNVNEAFYGTPLVQRYKTNLYWTYVDWFDASYDPTSIPDVTVANNLEFGKLTLQPNTHVKILNNGNNQFVVYYIDSNLTQNLVGIENGTIRITNGDIPALELRQIALALQTQIFVADLADKFNHLFFTMIKYALTEQKNLDWVFKTSFLSATQYIRALAQFPSYVADNQQYYLDYINEVKPYRTVVREFVVDYQGSDEYMGDTTDFDLPPYWDTSMKVYRSPNFEQSYDATTVTSGVYSQWANNYKYSVVDVIVERPGTGYLTAPQITIVGDAGTAAEGYATLNGSGGIASIVITNPGSDYTVEPEIIINGTGSGAVARAVLRNVYDKNNTGHNVIRSIGTTIKFDRVSYKESERFVFWGNLTSANIGQTIAANTVLVNNGQLFTLNSNLTLANLTFPVSSVTSITADSFNNANDRIIAFNGYVNLALTQEGLDYPGVIVTGNTFTSNVVDSTISSMYNSALGVNPSDINIDGGGFVTTFSSYAPEELVPGFMRDNLNVTVFDTGNVAFRMFSNMTSKVGNVTSDLSGNLEYYRIANENVTTLTANLNLTDANIHVANAAALAAPSLQWNRPGILFINGEKISYWVRDTNNNVISQIRRGVDGTYMPTVHATGTRVVDSSFQQLVPNSIPVSSNIGVSSKTYTTTANVSYKLQVSREITANIGQYITQKYSANSVVAANLRVLGNVVNSNVVPVIFISGSITTLANTVSVNGTATGANVISKSILGTVNSAGNVTLPANTMVQLGNIWTSNASSLDSSTTEQAMFLKAKLGFYANAGQTP